jgi:ribosomal protein S18 acetylase RimI-like enzyme
VLRFFRKRHQGKAFRDLAQLLSIVVAPHLRRAGLGKRFLDLWMEELRAADIPSFIVFSDNTEGLYFYRKHGGDCLFQFHLRSMLSACFRLHVTKPAVNTQSV